MKKIYIIILLAFFSIEINAQIWTKLTSGTTNALSSVVATNADTCYVVGASGTILKTVNAGATWSSQTSGTSSTLYSTAFVNGRKGFAVGDLGTVIKTTNGGTTWTSLTLTSAALRFVYFFNSTQGFITGAGGLMLRTTDGGSSWSPVTIATSGSINAVYFISVSIGYASGSNGLIVKTTDGGSTWSTLTSGTTTSLGIIHFTSATNGTVIGDGGLILQTVDSGISWSVVTSGTSDVLTGMDFLDSNNSFIVGGNISSNIGSMLKSTDGGSFWTYSLPGTSRLTRVDFLNANLGYAVGLDGTILKYTSNVGIATNSFIDETNIYPNPFNQQTTISFNKEIKNATLKIIDVLGKEVRNLNFSGNELVIEKGELKSGIYFIQVVLENEIITNKKIIIQ